MVVELRAVGERGGIRALAKGLAGLLRALPVEHGEVREQRLADSAPHHLGCSKQPSRPFGLAFIGEPGE